MAAAASRKKFRMELEFTVTMDEVSEQHLNANIPPQALPYLKHVQEALLSDENVLYQQILLNLVSQIQTYTDGLARQDNPNYLNRIDAAQGQDDSTGNPPPDIDFGLLTHPIRVSCLTSSLTDSKLSEEKTGQQGETRWETVWRDLRPQSELGRWINTRLANIPSTLLSGHARAHHFLVRSIYRLKNDVQLEASCTCGLSMHGVGEDEWQALESVWTEYHRHLQAYGLGCNSIDRSAVTFGEN